MKMFANCMETSSSSGGSSSRPEVMRVSGEDVSNHALVRSTNRAIFDALRSEDIESIPLVHRFISNHPTDYHLVRACYDFRLMVHIIAVMADEMEDLVTEAGLVERFAMFLNRQCLGKTCGKRCCDGEAPRLCQKRAMRGSLFCESHHDAKPGYAPGMSMGQIFIKAWDEGVRHYHTASTQPKQHA
jgi:hypothetical protein